MLLVMLMTIPMSLASTKIYVWRNAEGVLVYSDSPKPGSEEMDVKSPNVSKSSVDTSVLDIKPQKQQDDGFTIEITQPKDQATIRDNTGSVHVQGRIKPVFKRGLKVSLLVDGKPYSKPQNYSMFALRNIERGEHQLQMNLIDQQGNVVASSPVITFYMHRASVFKAK